MRRKTRRPGPSLAVETVTSRRGKAGVRPVPADAGRGAEIRRTIEEIRALRSRRENVTVEDLLSARDEGRRF